MSADGTLIPKGQGRKRHILLKILNKGQEGPGCHIVPDSRPRSKRCARAALFPTQGPGDKGRLQGTDLGPQELGRLISYSSSANNQGPQKRTRLPSCLLPRTSLVSKDIENWGLASQSGQCQRARRAPEPLRGFWAPLRAQGGLCILQEKLRLSPRHGRSVKQQPSSGHRPKSAQGSEAAPSRVWGWKEAASKLTPI